MSERLRGVVMPRQGKQVYLWRSPPPGPEIARDDLLLVTEVLGGTAEKREHSVVLVQRSTGEILVALQPPAGSIVGTPQLDMVRIHRCHWPGCTIETAPSFWGCKSHWFSLPAELRRRIWATYRPGQEIDKHPSPAYLAAHQAILAWIPTRG